MRGRRLGLLLMVAAVIVTGSYLYANLTASGGVEAVEAPEVPPAAAQIAFWEARVVSQPGITTYTYLAEAHLRSARISGDLSAYQRADAALDEALAINPNYREARFQMAAVRFALHDFDEARALAEALASARRPPAGTLLLLSDVYLALGDHEQADEALRIEHERAPGPATLSRQAILADLHGDTGEAIRLMEEAAEAARLGGALPEDRAWFEYQVGHLHLKSGDPGAARDRFERADELLPDYYLAQAGMARAAVAEGDFDEAIALYGELIAAAPQPEYLAGLGDLYVLQGDTASAEEQYATVEFIAELGEGAYDRQFTLFLLNHDLRLDEALVAAQRDVELRQDIYAWDTLAWALYKHDRFDEAVDAMTRALALGTRDAQLHYHAGMIQAALGNTDTARFQLETALDINPAFDPLQAELARATLANLS